MSASVGELGGAGSGRRIFVVEDEFLIRMLLEDMLDELGYTVAGVAGRLDEATEVAKSGEFDLAILDVNLGGVRSDALADELMKSGVPVILSTGYDPLGLAHLSKAAVLQKPFDAAALERAIGYVARHPHFLGVRRARARTARIAPSSSCSRHSARRRRRRRLLGPGGHEQSGE